jgi:flagellar biogenesis protein FliO
MQIVENNGCSDGKPETPAGLAAWLLMHFGGRLRMRFPRIGRPRDERRMKLAETLSLGGKRQLMLVICDGQRFLVGTGGDGVGTIVAVPPGTVWSEAEPVESKAKERAF